MMRRGLPSPALNHILKFTESGWVHVTAEELRARGVHYHISADSKMFLCDLCNEYALLTKDGANRSHFRHPQSMEHECPEKLIASGTRHYQFAFNNILPIKIVLQKETYRFELGFPALPSEILAHAERGNEDVTIIGGSTNPRVYRISNDRFSSSHTTYFPVDSDIFYGVKLNYSNQNSLAKKFWGTEIDGAFNSHLLFDEKTGRKLAVGATAKLNHPYLLLKNGYQSDDIHGVSIKKINVIPVNKSNGVQMVYQVVATEFTKNSAEFFQKCRTRLVTDDAHLIPIWPVSSLKNETILHPKNQEVMAFYYDGSGRVKQNYPFARVAEQVNRKPMYTIPVGGQQHIIALGRDMLIQYFYLSCESPICTPPLRNILITDVKGTEIQSNHLSQVPKDGLLNITSSWDGTVDVWSGNALVDRRKLRADTMCDLRNLKLGYTIQIYCGLDCVRTISFQDRKSPVLNEDILLHELQSIKGPKRMIGHASGYLMAQWMGYPKIIGYIRQCIRSGYIYEAAFQKLFCRNREDG